MGNANVRNSGSGDNEQNSDQQQQDLAQMIQQMMQRPGFAQMVQQMVQQPGFAQMLQQPGMSGIIQQMIPQLFQQQGFEQTLLQMLPQLFQQPGFVQMLPQLLQQQGIVQMLPQLFQQPGFQQLLQQMLPQLFQPRANTEENVAKKDPLTLEAEEIAESLKASKIQIRRPHIDEVQKDFPDVRLLYRDSYQTANWQRLIIVAEGALYKAKEPNTFHHFLLDRAYIGSFSRLEPQANQRSMDQLREIVIGYAVYKAKGYGNDTFKSDLLSKIDNFAKAHPNYPGIWMLKVGVLMSSGNYEEALPAINKCLELRRDWPNAKKAEAIIRYKLRPNSESKDEDAVSSEAKRDNSLDDILETVLSDIETDPISDPLLPKSENSQEGVEQKSVDPSPKATQSDSVNSDVLAALRNLSINNNSANRSADPQRSEDEINQSPEADRSSSNPSTPSSIK